MRVIKKTVLKLLFLCLSVLAFSAILKVVVAHLKNDLKLSESLPKNSNNAFFVGNSRTQGYFNENILNQNKANLHCYNLGMAGLSLNYAEPFIVELLETQKPAIIFVELSKIRPVFPTHFQHLCSWKALKIGLSRCSKQQIFQNFGYLTFQILSIKDDVKALFAPNSLEVYWGYTESKLIYNGNEQNFVKLPLQNSSTNVESYIKIVQNLIEKAEKNGTKIVFYVPFTFGSLEEQLEISNVYNSVSSQHKIAYPQELLTQIQQKSYLMDANHVNKQGSLVISAYFRDNVLESPLKQNAQ